MKNNLDNKIYDANKTSEFLLDSMDSIKSKIATSKLVRGVSKAVSCVTGIVSGVYILGSAGTSDYLDEAFTHLSEAQRIALDASFHDSLMKGIIIGAVSAGCAGIAYLMGKYIEEKRDDLHLTKVAYKNNEKELDSLEEEKALNERLGVGEEMSYQEFASTYVPTQSIQEEIKNEPLQDKNSIDEILRHQRFLNNLNETKDLFESNPNDGSQNGDGREE